MVIICYDISNDKLRTKFSKYLKKFGYRLQYSVFKIDNSNRILNNIITEIKNNFEKKFEQSDSVIIYKFKDNVDMIKFGYAINEDKSLIIIN